MSELSPQTVERLQRLYKEALEDPSTFPELPTTGTFTLDQFVTALLDHYEIVVAGL